MNEQKQHQVQQDAFMWFKNTYGKTPQEFGANAAIPRIKRIGFFLKSQQVVFAPEQKTAIAFIKAQTILDLIVNSVIFIFPGIGGAIFYALILLGQNKINAALSIGSIIIFFCILVMITLVVCCKKLKPLEKLYKDRVIVYTA